MGSRALAWIRKGRHPRPVICAATFCARESRRSRDVQACCIMHTSAKQRSCPAQPDNNNNNNNNKLTLASSPPVIASVASTWFVCACGCGDARFQGRSGVRRERWTLVNFSEYGANERIVGGEGEKKKGGQGSLSLSFSRYSAFISAREVAQKAPLQREKAEVAVCVC